MTRLSLGQQASSIKLTARRRDALIIVVAAAVQLIHLLMAHQSVGAWGYPLDDSWIYQTYARNFAQTGQWAFIPGVPSTGSTSILWMLLLVPGYLLPFSAYIWTQLMGFASLVAVGLGAARLFPEDSPGLSLMIGLAVVMEWHLVWAAASGMETTLFAALLVWFWVWLRRHDPAEGHRWQNGLVLGVWGGVLMLTRPEGVLAMGAAGLYGLLRGGSIRKRLVWGAAAGAGFALILLPFFGFNYTVNGSVWPNTFYAKQTEYAPLYETSFLLRYFNQMTVMFVGAHILLIPGLLSDIWQRIKMRIDLVGLVPIGWVLLHWGIYAARLPVTYQHGRYTIPVVPVLVIYGIRGALKLANRSRRSRALRVLSQVWLLTTAVLFVTMVVVLAAPAYARDVAFIQGDMVATARWVDENVPEGTVIAVHDIGAIGYFAPRPLVDLAGLVSPEVIPVMDDAGGLVDFIEANGAEYLIIFPGWSPTYQQLVEIGDYEVVWSSAEQPGYEPVPRLGPMTVYRVGG